MAQPQQQSWFRSSEGEELLGDIYDNDESLTKVDLEFWLEDEDVGELADALESNTNIQELCLRENSIGVGVTALAGVLQDNSTLTRLDLGANEIRDREAEAMAGLVHNNSTIESLNLNGNYIEDGGGRALAMALIHNSTLQELYLAHNEIDDEGAEALARAICLNPSLTYLTLFGNDRIGERGTRALNTAMRYLGGGGISQEDLTAFAKGFFAKTSPIQLGPEELGAIKQHLTARHNGGGEFELDLDPEGNPETVMRAGQQNLLRAVVGEGMVRAAVSEKEDHAVLMIAVRAVMANGIKSFFAITRAKPGLFKFSESGNNV